MKLTPELKETVIRIARGVCGASPSGLFVEFAERFLAALPNSEPVGVVKEHREHDGFHGVDCSHVCLVDKSVPVGTKLYTAPPIQQDYKAQLAESQAREAKLRDVLTQVREQCLFSDDEGEIGISNEAQIDLLLFDAICMAIKSTDATALNELIAKAGEVMRERCAAIRYDEKLENTIRALPSVTLEDL